MPAVPVCHASGGGGGGGVNTAFGNRCCCLHLESTPTYHLLTVGDEGTRTNTNNRGGV